MNYYIQFLEFQEWTELANKVFDYSLGFDKPQTVHKYDMESGSNVWDLAAPMSVKEAEKDTLRGLV